MGNIVTGQCEGPDCDLQVHFPTDLCDKCTRFNSWGYIHCCSHCQGYNKSLICSKCTYHRCASIACSEWIKCGQFCSQCSDIKCYCGRSKGLYLQCIVCYNFRKFDKKIVVQTLIANC